MARSWRHGNRGWYNPDYPDNYPVIYDTDIVVARFMPDGTPDKSFGNDGRVVTNFDYLENITGVAVQTDGKIVVGGYQTLDIYGNSNGFLVARYNKEGTLDTSFGNNEGYSIYYENRGSYAYDLLLQPDGKILLGGKQLANQFMVARYLMNGLPDESFGKRGVVLTSFANAASGVGITGITLDEKGRIAATGNLNYDKTLEVVRYLSNGLPDKTFGKDGQLELSTNGVTDKAIQSNSILAQPGNKLIVTGISSGLLLTGLNEDGSIDEFFGTDNGQTLINNGFGKDPAYMNATMQSDGKIIISGSSMELQSGDIFPVTYYLTRFNGYPTRVSLLVRVSRWLQNHSISWKGLPAEDNIAYYSIEQSAGSNNGFLQIAKVNGRNNLKDYSITNCHLLKEINYYRIKAVAQDGTIRYSEVVSADNGTNTASVFPNPASNFIIVKGLPANETANINIKDGSGTIISTGVSAGSGQYNSTRRSNLKPGTYYLDITTGTKTQTLKFVKE